MRYSRYILIVYSITLIPLSLLSGSYMRLNNHLLSLSTVVLIIFLSLYVVVIDELSDMYYIIVIYSIALSLLLLTTGISDYIVGWDMNVEYQVYQYTKNNLFWGDIGYENQNILNYNSVLSVTIFPLMFDFITGINGNQIFKYIYPLIFSFIMMNIYLMNKKVLKDSKYAFITSILYLSPYSFSSAEMISLGKQMIAMTLLSLVVYIYIKYNKLTKEIFVILIFLNLGIIMMHYSTFYISMFILVIMYAYYKFYSVKKNLTINYLMIIIVMALIWYGYVANKSAPIYYLFKAVIRTIDFQIENSFATNLTQAMRGTILRSIGAGFFYAIHGVIFLGFLLLTRNSDKNKNYYPISFGGISLIVTVILAPNLADTLNITRFYQISMIFISSLYMIGFIWLTKISFNISDNYRKLLSLIVVLCLFMFQKGLIYEIAGDTSGLTSRALSLHRLDEEKKYIGTTNDRDVFSAIWLSEYGSEDLRTSVFSDGIAMWHVLASYGLFPSDNDRIIDPNFNIIRGYLYLTSYNTEYNELIIKYGGIPRFRAAFNESVISDENIIFSNGGNRIYIIEP